MGIITGNKNQWMFFIFSQSFKTAILLAVIAVLLLGAKNQAVAQSPQINTSSSTTPYDQMQSQGAQVNQQPQELADTTDYEQNLEVFDPSTIPESVANADWIFQVPVNVKNISNVVKEICIICRTLTKSNKKREIKVFGASKKNIQLVNGGFHGDVIIGVNQRDDAKKYTPQANKYDCIMWLVDPDDPDGKLSKPVPSRNDNHWSAMNIDKPFKWKTGIKRLP
jgi:hypothetical protein